MKLSILLLLVLATWNTYGQKTKKVTKKFDDYTETYYVLKKNKYRKHGPYKKIGVTGKTLEEGNYTNGFRGGLWKFYQPSGIISSEGNYDKGYKTGVWKEYGWLGKLEKKYDHDSGELVFYDPKADTTTHTIRDGDDIRRVRLEWPPVHMDTEQSLMKFIQTEINYPQLSVEMGEQGIVLISFYVNADGTVNNFEIAKSVSKLLDEEALRVVKLMPDNWKPGRYNGKEIAVRVSVPIHFRIA